MSKRKVVKFVKPGTQVLEVAANLALRGGFMCARFVEVIIVQFSALTSVVETHPRRRVEKQRDRWWTGEPPSG